MSVLHSSAGNLCRMNVMSYLRIVTVHVQQTFLEFGSVRLLLLSVVSLRYSMFSFVVHSFLLCIVLLNFCVVEVNGWERKYMNCDSVCGTPYCGVLTLQRGEGPRKYRHRTPQIHGLWPQVGKYGSSECFKSPVKTISNLQSCYSDRSFAQHEWSAHGKCAEKTPNDYFEESCALSALPLQIMANARAQGENLQTISAKLTQANFHVWNTNPATDEVSLTVCSGRDLNWTFLKASDDIPSNELDLGNWWSMACMMLLVAMTFGSIYWCTSSEFGLFIECCDHTLTVFTDWRKSKSQKQKSPKNH